MTTLQHHDIKRHPTVTVNINDLTFDEQNPNVMSQQEEAGLRKSFHTFGDVSPIVIDQNNFIVHGNHRAAVLKELGATEINAVRKEFSSNVERIECAQTLNKLHGEYDKQLDSAQLLQVLNAGRLDNLAELIAKGREELENTLTKYQGIHFQHEDDFNVEKALEDLVPETQLGDIWQLGEHRIICADCTDSKSIDRLIPEDQKIAQLNADPPYGVSYGSKNEYMNEHYGYYEKRITEQYDNDTEQTDYTEMFRDIFNNLKAHFADYNTIYIWCSGKIINQILNAFDGKEFIMSQLLIWLKNSPVPTRTDYWLKHEPVIYGWYKRHKFYAQAMAGSRSTVLQYDRPLHNNQHPTMKPVEMIAQTINDTTLERDIVLDTFLGSGTTLVACEQTRRICYGVEIDPHYVEVAVKRWEAYTKRKATRLGGDA